MNPSPCKFVWLAHIKSDIKQNLSKLYILYWKLCSVWTITNTRDMMILGENIVSLTEIVNPFANFLELLYQQSYNFTVYQNDFYVHHFFWCLGAFQYHGHLRFPFLLLRSIPTLLFPVLVCNSSLFDVCHDLLNLISGNSCFDSFVSLSTARNNVHWSNFWNTFQTVLWFYRVCFRIYFPSLCFLLPGLVLYQ